MTLLKEIQRENLTEETYGRQHFGLEHLAVPSATKAGRLSSVAVLSRQHVKRSHSGESLDIARYEATPPLHAV
jgi:hypothetical protein